MASWYNALMPIKDIHVWSLQTSTSLSRYYMPRTPTPIEVIKILNKEKISFVLVGLHGIGGWMNDPRATQDVDVIVTSRHHKKSIKTLQAAFPHLQVQDREVVTRMVDPETEKVVIDVMKTNQPIIAAVFKNTKAVAAEGQAYRIPSLEMALALKLAPMVSLTRLDEDKHQDAHDFITMVKSNPVIDLDKAAELGDLVYSGGGKELLEKIRQVRAGEKLQL